ncbi:hypothetical protein MYCTH_2111197 [Thermothelomyces thermophilus ATCC 42464]|uniref:Uncharacterized protein n=1 Tax=Thermothelomyces thermophilus (strain ATCC 42464 / BCRC 31852 / DSM 1799) TaxID=573729 RepID=G2QHT6_THET4|nr:uncharacterized protein MYCTH_2111197 [Thermothelomyces thermophilus ATCC 42464]AEO58946.1 hypothetical protein MYCTH_2111197 [Thermothelomyces thermophilus ATCC 42464]
MTLRWGGKELVGGRKRKLGEILPVRLQLIVWYDLNRRVLGLGSTLMMTRGVAQCPISVLCKDKAVPSLWKQLAPPAKWHANTADHRGIALFTDGGGLGLGGKPHLPVPSSDPSSDLNHVDDAAPLRFSKAPSQPEWLELGPPFGSSTLHVVMTTGSVLAEAVLEASQRLKKGWAKALTSSAHTSPCCDLVA